MKLKDQLKIVDALKQKNIDAKAKRGSITLDIRGLKASEIHNATALVDEMIHDLGYNGSEFVMSYSQDYIWVRKA